MNINQRLLLGAGSDMVLAKKYDTWSSISTNRYRYFGEDCDWLLSISSIMINKGRNIKLRTEKKCRRTETTITLLLVDFYWQVKNVFHQNTHIITQPLELNKLYLYQGNIF